MVLKLGYTVYIFDQGNLGIFCHYDVKKQTLTMSHKEVILTYSQRNGLKRLSIPV